MEAGLKPHRADEGGRGEIFALAALAFLLVVTGLWWALALWPAPQTAPAWLQATRAVCFGVYHSGLPDAGGWILLVGEPLGMTAALYVVWRRSLTSALRGVASRRAGRAILATGCVAVAVGVAAAGWRVASARDPFAGPADAGGTAAAPPAAKRLDRPAPPLRLVDQFGDTLTLERFSGRPVLVAFAYAHCETVCPVVVRNVVEVQRRLGEAAPALVVVTLDPWRDTPARLPHIVSSWGMGPGGFLLSGDVATVQRVLADWGVEIARDPRTGEVAHAPITYLVDSRGMLAWATHGSTEEILSLLGTLASGQGRAGETTVSLPRIAPAAPPLRRAGPPERV